MLHVMHDLRLLVHDTRTCCIMAQSLFSGRSPCSQPDVLNTSGTSRYRQCQSAAKCGTHCELLDH